MRLICSTNRFNEICCIFDAVTPTSVDCLTSKSTATVTFKKHLKTLLFNVAYGPAFL